MPHKRKFPPKADINAKHYRLNLITLILMAQQFKERMILGQGNFGAMNSSPT
jgi:hypothetical protein